MEKKIKKILEEKISESLGPSAEIFQIANSYKEVPSSIDSISLGIIIGRVYNSFYYQTRRIKKRDPTKDEFQEFLELLKKHKIKIFEKIKKN